MASPTTAHGTLEDALASAVALLADIEAQIRSALGLSPADSLSSLSADPEQLQHVPPKLLESLESAVCVVQELRDQLHAQSQQGDSPPPAAKRCASPQQTRTRRPASVSTPQPRHARSAPNIAAARSALFDRGASDCAVSHWHEAKLQQQEEAALAQGRLLAREEQAQQALDDAEEAAHLAHVQEMQDTQQLSSAVSLLGVLLNSGERWIAYQQQTLEQQKVVASRVLQRLPAPQQPGASLPRSSSTSNSSSSSSSSRRFSNATAPRAALWSRQPDELDQQWEQEEAARRQQRQQLTLAQQAAEEAAWRQQVDQVHQQLLDQQKHKAALRQRLQQDAQRAKREQLRRIEPVAKARARASGLASLGLDPEIMALSEKFGRLSGLVDEVQQRMEAQYGLYGSDWDASLGGQLPPSPATNRQQGPSRLAAGQQQLQQPMQQAPPQMGARAWPQQPRLRSQQLPQQQQQPQQQQPALQRLPQTGPGARTQQRPQQQQQVPSLQQPPVTQQQAQGGMPLRPASFQGAVPAQPQHQSAWQSSSSQPWQQPVAPPQQHEPATGHRAPV